MQDLTEVIQSYEGTGVLLVTDYRVPIVAQEILKTIRLLQECWIEDDQKCDWSKLDKMVLETFGLDIREHQLHTIMWENWMKFISDLGLIDIQIRWAYPFDLDITKKEIEYLESVASDTLPNM